MKQAWMLVGVATLLGGCWKHETSAPHTSLKIELEGKNTNEIMAERFDDGWSVRFERFWVSPTFGVDDIYDPVKDDGPRVTGAEAYVYYGGESFDLATPASYDAFGGWILAGHSTGWGMRLRVATGSPGSPERPISLEVVGEADGPSGEKVAFAWSFTNEVLFAHCVEEGASSLSLPEGDLTLRIALDGASLFRREGSASLSFARLAEGDLDDDGVVTSEELRELPLSNEDALLAPAGARDWHDVLSSRLTGLVSRPFACEVQAPVLE